MRRSARTRLSVLALFFLLSLQGFASGPRFVTGPPFFTGAAGVPVVWKQAQLTYFTDPGSLSASVNHAASDALVASAAAVWNIPQASVTLSQAGSLAEHVSGQNVYLDSSGMVFPDDMMSSNAAAVPIAIVYDTDGSVTDTLLGPGASAPGGCRSNAVTESVDSFDPTGYILHAVIVLNGRCTGPAAAQQMELEYKLVRAFGRVLGLGWSQANDNVFTGVPTPTYAQAMHWPLMHPIDIICGPYSFQCLPSPFMLRPDDVASMVLLYPNADGAVLAAGKQISLAAANTVSGTMSFPTGAGMAGVNVLVRRQPGFSTDTDAWVEISGVTGSSFRGSGNSPFVAADSGPLGSMGSTRPDQPGLYNLPYIPMLDEAMWDDLVVLTEPVNLLYVGAHSVGPYSLGAVTPSGSPPSLPTLLVVNEGSQGNLPIPVTDAAATCGNGTDGTAGSPAEVAATGWWRGLLCGIGHAAYVSLNVRAGRSLTIEATALDEQGLATTGKAMPVVALFAPTDHAWDPPSLGVTPSAFQALTIGTTTLSAGTGQGGALRVGVADERGDGRPDYAFQGRIFYADDLQPGRVPDAGGTITITGMGFRGGNSVLVNGVPATVKSWTPNTIVAVVPTIAAAGAIHGTAVDVQVLDRGTGANSILAAALTYDPSPTLQKAMILLSAPAGTVLVGTPATASLSVRVVAWDGLTPIAEDSVTFSTVSGTVFFGACAGAGSCAVRTDSTGLASTAVTPVDAGSIVLQAQDGALLQTATFEGEAGASAMRVLSAPTGAWPTGTQVNVPFVVRVIDANGNGLSGRLIRFHVVGGSALFPTCFASICSETTDSSGSAGIFVTPTSGGTVTLEAADGAVTQQISFPATDASDTMQLYEVPSATANVGAWAGTFSVRLLKADGTSGDYGQPVNFSGPPGVIFGACASAACPLFTNSYGGVGTSVLANQAGTFTIQASYGPLVKTATFTTTVPTLSLHIVSAPTGNVPVGLPATVPFSAEVVGYDGKPLPNVIITMAGPGDQVLINACGQSSCQLLTDSNGVATTTVIPLRPGNLTLDAAHTPLTATASFMAVPAIDILRVTTQPGTGPAYLGDSETFTVQLLQPSGLPDAGKNVSFSVTNGVFSLEACGVSCNVVTDANGMASITGTGAAPGGITVTVTSGALVQAMNFVETVRTDVLQLLSAPNGIVFSGVPAAASFSLQVFAPDGVTPAPNQRVMLSATSGTVLFGACGAASCSVISDANGIASSTVTPLAAGAIVLTASIGTNTKSAAFVAVTRPNPETLTAVQGTAYVAAGVLFARVVDVAALENGIAAAGQALAWSTAGDASVQTAAALTDAQGSGRAQAIFGPLLAGKQGQVTACAWGTTCVSFAAVGVSSADLSFVVVSGGAQTVSGGTALAPVQIRVVDGGGHGVAGATVRAEQTVTALTLPCPATGRCPAQPVLLSGLTAATSDADGLVSIEPLTIPGTATETHVAFSAGDQAFQTAVLVSRP